MPFQRALAFTLGSTLALLAGLMPTNYSLEWRQPKPPPQLALPPPAGWRWAQWLLNRDHRRGVPMLPPPPNISSALVLFSNAGGEDAECHPAFLLAAAVVALVLCYLIARVACKLALAIYSLLLRCIRPRGGALSGMPDVDAPDNAPATPPRPQPPPRQAVPESPGTGVQPRREGRVDPELVRVNVARVEADRLRLQAERAAREALRRQEQLERELAHAAHAAHIAHAKVSFAQRPPRPSPPVRCCHPNKYNWGNQHGRGWKCPDCGAEGRRSPPRRVPPRRGVGTYHLRGSANGRTTTRARAVARTT